MQYLTMDIKNEHSQDYAALYLCLLDNSPEMLTEERPMIIVCPGGGYHFTSDREAEVIALQYLAMGYHAAVLRYSVAPARFPAAIMELGRAVALIRANAGEWYVNRNQIVVTGFSAGGHLAASYCTFWNQAWMAEGLGVTSESLRPNGAILSYPVISSGEYGHQGSFKNLLGEDYEKRKEEFSLEKYVGEQVPRTFIWHTYEDQLVPVQNSLMYADALVKNHIPVEFHLFEKGVHGMALGNRQTASTALNTTTAAPCSAWIEMVHKWMEGWMQA